MVKWLKHRTLTPTFTGSNPVTPVRINKIQKKTTNERKGNQTMEKTKVTKKVTGKKVAAKSASKSRSVAAESAEMGFIYRMPKRMYDEIRKEADDEKKLNICRYVDEFFGLRGRCMRVELV